MNFEMSYFDEREAAVHKPDEYFELKAKIHDRLLDVIDLSIIETVERSLLKAQIKDLLTTILQEEKSDYPLNYLERGQILQEIEDEILGLGPLEPLLRDPSISDILVNTYNQIFLERYGRLELTLARFKDDDHLMKIIDRIVSSVGRRIDESTPMVDARLKDGSRVNAIIPPLAIDGPILSIRRFSVQPLKIKDLILLKTLPKDLAPILEGVVKSKLNVIISGGTGSGKTTLLNVMSRFIPESERIVTIEDAAELQLHQEHLVRLETRPANIEGEGLVTQRELVKNSLRMRPDRIIVGEVRGGEALDMLQAMNTGHEGSLTTIHANTPRDALMRLETMVSMSGVEIPSVFLRRFICSAIDVILQVERLTDGNRRIVSLQELTGMEGDVITMQEIFTFRKMAVNGRGKIRGQFTYTGIRPRFLEKFETAGVSCKEETFDPENVITI